MKNWILALLTILSMVLLADLNTRAGSSEASRYIFVWSGDAAHKSSDFLAVVDTERSSATYARIVATLPVDVTGTMPHHTEYEFPQGNVLFANGWMGNRTFLFDLNRPLQPRLIGQFQDRSGYTFAHSFVRLPNRHVLATFQSHGEGYAPGGGLVELDETGAVVRAGSAIDSTVDKDLIWPYSLVALPQADRVVSTSTPMGWADWATLPPNSWPQKRSTRKTPSSCRYGAFQTCTCSRPSHSWILAVANTICFLRNPGFCLMVRCWLPRLRVGSFGSETLTPLIRRQRWSTRFQAAIQSTRCVQFP